MQDNAFVKKAFFDHLKREGFTDEHLEAYDEYFDFFLEHVGEADLMDLGPEVIYRVALTSTGQLEGDDVIEAYLKLMEFFMEWWAERWEAMNPEEYEGREPPTFDREIGRLKQGREKEREKDD